MIETKLSGINWRGRPLEELSKEELIKCITDLMHQQKMDRETAEKIKAVRSLRSR